MNAQAEAALSSFVEKLDDFLVDCSKYEESGAWDVEKLGYMSAYFEADLTGVVMQTMSMDGRFERAEAEVFNRMFSTNYTPKMLREHYVLLKPVIDDYCDTESGRREPRACARPPRSCSALPCVWSADSRWRNGQPKGQCDTAS